MATGLPIVISGPSGSGKSTICSELLREMPELKFSVSCTTRIPRPGEVDGKDYIFINEQEFRKRVVQKEFLEWALVHGNYYGTPRTFVEQNIVAGNDVLFDVDIKGGMKLRQVFPDSSVLIFVALESPAILRKRLEERNKNSEEEIQKRLIAAKEEMFWSKEYDYLIINDVLDTAVSEVKSIFFVEKKRVKRIPKKFWENIK